VVVPHASYLKNAQRWFGLCNRLAGANVSYRLLVAGDAIVDRPLDERDLRSARALLVPERNDFLPEDQRLLARTLQSRRVLGKVEEALAEVTPAVKVQADGVVRVLPRVKGGSAVVHLLNYGYDAARDGVVDTDTVRLQIDLKALGVDGADSCRWVGLEGEPQSLVMRDGRVEVPRLGLWGLLALRGPDIGSSRGAAASQPK
jgi:hypothetical protein